MAGWPDTAKGTAAAQESGNRSWKVLSPSHVELQPFMSHEWIFVVDFDPALEKGRIVEGEYKRPNDYPARMRRARKSGSRYFKDDGLRAAARYCA